jgi:peptide-methionine (S)-S-oxide reductase
MRKIGFGGGCHWCTEAVFQSLHGVELVEQGWIASLPPFDSFSEGVIVHFNEEITLETLIDVHLLTHSSGNSHRMRNKYRSAVYYFDESDKVAAESRIVGLASENETRYITQVLPFTEFKGNTESYLDYYKRNKEGSFCQTYINPKLEAIRKKFGRQVRDNF